MKYAVTLLLSFLAASSAMADTVVAARTIRAQAILSGADVVLTETDLEGAYTALDEVVGLEARVAIYAGRPIRIDDIGPPAVIDRNQLVTLVYRSGGLSMAAEGRALGRAGVGDRLRVMNLSSRQTVTGLVRADGSVAVGASHPEIPFPLSN